MWTDVNAEQWKSVPVCYGPRSGKRISITYNCFQCRGGPSYHNPALPTEAGPSYHTPALPTGAAPSLLYSNPGHWSKVLQSSLICKFLPPTLWNNPIKGDFLLSNEIDQSTFQKWTETWGGKKSVWVGKCQNSQAEGMNLDGDWNMAIHEGMEAWDTSGKAGKVAKCEGVLQHWQRQELHPRSVRKGAQN